MFDERYSPFEFKYVSGEASLLRHQRCIKATCKSLKICAPNRAHIFNLTFPRGKGPELAALELFRTMVLERGGNAIY